MRIPITDRRGRSVRIVGFVEISEKDAKELARSLGMYAIIPTAIDRKSDTVAEFAIRTRHPPVAAHHEGYQPTNGELDASNPPRGGSGVPQRVGSGKPGGGRSEV